MIEYIVKTNNKKRIFYYKPYQGIYEKYEKPGGWGEEKNICPNAKEPFFAYSDNDGTVHIIAVSQDNYLVYLLNKSEDWKNFEIGKINDTIKIKRIMIGLSKIGENLFYSAEYNGESILVHCLLGDKAMPSTIAKLYDDHFFIYKDRVYYQNTENMIVYQDFSDSKPNHAYKICEGTMPYLTSIDAQKFFVCKNGSEICVNNKPYITDKDAENPVLFQSDNDKILMWQCGDFIRYTVYEENKNNAIRTIASGKKPTLYILSDADKSRLYFGGFFLNKLRLYPNVDPFLQDENDMIKKNEEFYKKEINRINKLLAKQKNDIKQYRNEIKKLNDIISKISENSLYTENSE